MNYYNLAAASEVKQALRNIMEAFESGTEEISFAGRTVRKQVSRKGTEFFVLDAGLPATVRAYKSMTGKGHMITIDLGLHRTQDMGSEGLRPIELRIRGHMKRDVRGQSNVFFFDPISEGYRTGAIMTKIDLVERGLVDPRVVFTVEEIDEGVKSRTITREKAEELRELVR